MGIHKQHLLLANTLVAMGTTHNYSYHCCYGKYKQYLLMPLLLRGVHKQYLFMPLLLWEIHILVKVLGLCVMLTSNQ